MLLATASQAAFDRSSSGRMTTWLRTPTRPFLRRQPQNVSPPFFFATALPFFFAFFAMICLSSVIPVERGARVPESITTNLSIWPPGLWIPALASLGRDDGRGCGTLPAFRLDVVD